MVDLHKGFDGFERLGPSRKEKDDAELLLSKDSGKEPGSLLRPDMAKSEAFYEEVLAFTRSLLDRVKEGKADGIKAEEITGPTKAFCDKFKSGMGPDDLVRMVFKKDEYKENYLYNHSVNVCFLAVRVAIEMNFADNLMHELIMAALFHDVGMMKVPMEIWNNNRRLTDNEYDQVRRHALYGEEIMKGIGGISEVVPVIIGQHQEKVDGTGYPRGLTKDAIHYIARLLSLLDAYEALTHTRLWRQRFLPDKSIQQILDEESSGYDPHFLKAVLRHISIFPVGAWVSVSTGEVGEVVKTNSETPMRPIINVVFDRSKKRLARPKVLDLAKQLLIHVDYCVDPDSISAR